MCLDNVKDKFAISSGRCSVVGYSILPAVSKVFGDQYFTSTCQIASSKRPEVLVHAGSVLRK